MLHRLSRLIGCVPSSWKAGYDVANGIGLMNLPGCMIEPNRDMALKSLQNALPTTANQQALDLIH